MPPRARVRRRHRAILAGVTDDGFGRFEVQPAAAGGRGLAILGFPLRVELWFFVTAYLIGPRDHPGWSLAWVAMVLVGVLLHELGHALAGRRLGLEPWIQLHAFGGLTAWRQPRPLTPRQEILVSAAGPAMGIVIGAALLVVAAAGVVEGDTGQRVLEYAVWVNLGWGVLNLVPVLPLDGGHIAASLARLVLGERGRVMALGLSIVLTVLLAGWALASRQWWLAILGVVLTLANVRSLKAAIQYARGGGRTLPPTPGGSD